MCHNALEYLVMHDRKVVEQSVVQALIDKEDDEMQDVWTCWSLPR